jgi:hypothetical protein
LHRRILASTCELTTRGATNCLAQQPPHHGLGPLRAGPDSLSLSPPLARHRLFDVDVRLLPGLEVLLMLPEETRSCFDMAVVET